MAITTSAKKALRQSKRRKIGNDRRMRNMRAATKAMSRAPSQAALAAAYQAVDKARKRGLIKKNTAARKKSQLAKLVASK